MEVWKIKEVSQSEISKKWAPLWASVKAHWSADQKQNTTTKG